jgi:hypothetical protein
MTRCCLTDGSGRFGGCGACMFMVKSTNTLDPEDETVMFRNVGNITSSYDNA